MDKYTRFTLTDEQKTILRPLAYKAREDANKGELGLILMQPDDNLGEVKCLFFTHEHAKRLAAIAREYADSL